MSIQAAFIGVVVIWSTTPLAIQWSSTGGGYLFGVASRMVLGLFVCLVLIALFLGQMLNDEIIGPREWAGTFVILLGLAIFEWGEGWLRFFYARAEGNRN